MPLVPILALSLVATMLVDLTIVLYGATRSEIFWPTALCASLAGFSAVTMALVDLDFDGSPAIYGALAILALSALVSLLPALRSVA